MVDPIFKNHKLIFFGICFKWAGVVAVLKNSSEIIAIWKQSVSLIKITNNWFFNHYGNVINENEWVWYRTLDQKM